MSVLQILEYPDKRLREKALPVDNITLEIQHLIDDMAETMYAAPGVGLAATQVGRLLRLFVVDCAPDDAPSDLRVFINPQIVHLEGDLVWKEGCLSFPGVSENVERAAHVTIKALGRDGTPFELQAEGLLGVAVQHETEHLDGKLMIDRLGPVRKRVVLRSLKKHKDSDD